MKTNSDAMRWLAYWFSLVLSVGLVWKAKADTAMPVFQADGSFKTTKATVSMGESGTVVVKDSAGISHSIYPSLTMRSTGQWFTINSALMANQNRTVDIQNRQVTYRGSFTPSGGTPIPTTWSMRLQEGGRIRLALTFETTQPILVPLSYADILINTNPRSGLAGRTLMADSVNYVVPGSNSVRLPVASGIINTLTYCSDVPDRLLRFYHVTSESDYLLDNGIDSQINMFYKTVSTTSTTNRIEFDIQLPDEPSPYIDAVPTMDATGKVSTSLASMIMDSNGNIVLTDSSGMTYNLYLSMVYKANGVWFSSWTTLNKVRTVNQTAKSVTLTGTIQPPAGSVDLTPIPYSLMMQVQTNNKVRVTASFTRVGGGSIFDILSTCDINCDLRPRSSLVGHQIDADGTVFSIINVPPNGRTPLASTPISTIAFVADQLSRKILQERVVSAAQYLDDFNRTTDNPTFIETRDKAVYTAPSSNVVSLDFTFPKEKIVNSAEYYGKVDFWDYDRLRLPQFGSSVNLISNPSFETGVQYWRSAGAVNNKITTTTVDPYYVIDAAQYYHGSQSLKMIGKQGQKAPMLATFAVPVESGQTYTLSYYAKKDWSGASPNLNVENVTAVWGTFINGDRVLARPTITTTWTRYTHTFTSINGLLSFGFTLDNPSADCNVWIDAVQLEKASSASAFTQRAISLALSTNTNNNLYEPGTNPSAAVKIKGPANTVGKLAVYVRPFDSDMEERKYGQTTHTLDASGNLAVSQTWAASLPAGIYSVRIDFYVNGTGVTHRDYSRLTVMPFVSVNQTGREFFAFNSLSPSAISRFLTHVQRMGAGSMISFDPINPSGVYPMLSGYGISRQFSSIFNGGENVIDLNANGDDLYFKANQANGDPGYYLTGTQLSQLTAWAQAKASANPSITTWKLVNEPIFTGSETDATHLERMRQTLQAAVDGVRAYNPNATIITNDPAVMTSGAINYIDKYLQVSGLKNMANVLGIHTYRTQPENPDLDVDIQSLKNVLATRGFTGDIWFTEGVYHQNYMLPPYNLNVHVGCSSDSYRGGPFTYDMGWAERMCAAYTARTWLISLKHRDRVKMHLDWGLINNSQVDFDMTPGASIFSVNTLCRLLGDASYAGQPEIGANIRCYVYTDGMGRHVAAIWYYSIPTDTGTDSPAVLDLTHLQSQYSSGQLETINFMGVVSTTLPSHMPLKPWPIFIRANSGTASQLINALDQTVIESDY